MTFRGHTTDYIPFDSSLTTLKSRLEALPSITKVHVIYDTDKLCLYNSYSCTKMCEKHNLIDIEFTTEMGDLPMVSLNTRTLDGQAAIWSYINGTRENLECSRLGICNEDTGICACLAGWGSSAAKEFRNPDGSNSRGHRGDCGWRNIHSTALGFEREESESTMALECLTYYRGECVEYAGMAEGDMTSTTGLDLGFTLEENL